MTRRSLPRDCPTEILSPLTRHTRVTPNHECFYCYLVILTIHPFQHDAGALPFHHDRIPLYRQFGRRRIRLALTKRAPVQLQFRK